MTAKDELHRLIDGVSDVDADLWLAVLRDHDPLAWALVTAPIDDEPETEDEKAAVAKARKRVARGNVISHEVLARELGW
ncbi:MAG: hypothetical protein HW416_20 [Chloroflexi bacterium]|nr:hypothetical protein [Chloroflexota bacterium]